jgi:sn-glycerol 3-phosphate transport system substrate-binding protein
MMMNRSRARVLTAVLLALLLVAAACSGDDDGGGGGGGGGAVGGDASGVDCPVDALEDASGPVEITFWHGMVARNEEILTALTDEYNGSQDRVRVNLVYQGTYDDTADKFENGVRSGEGLPQMVQLEETRLQFAIDSQAMLPAQACVDAEGYDLSDHLPAVIDEFTVDDTLWPMPFNVSNPVLFYVKPAFTAAQLDPEDPPATFDELRATAQQLVDSDAAQAGLAIDLSPWYVEQWFAQENQALVDHDNGRSARAETMDLDSDLGREIYEFLDGMVNDGLVRSVGRNERGVDHLLALAQGDAAMTIGSSAAIGPALAVIRSGEVELTEADVGIAPLPAPTDDPAGGTLVGGASLYLVAEGASEEQQAATWDYAKFLNDPQTQARWSETGYIPIRRSAVDLDPVPQLWQTTPGYRVAYDQILASETDFGGPVIGAYFEARDAIVKSLERMFQENQAPEEAVRTADEEAEREMQDYNSRAG